MNNKEIVMETTHGRKSKCKTEFKAVLNKVLVSSVVLATLIGGSGVSALADANIPNDYTNLAVVQMQDTVSSLRSTIEMMEELKAEGYITEVSLKNLAKEIDALQSAAVNADEVHELLDRAEAIIEDLDKDNVSLVKSAIANAREKFGVRVIEENYEATQFKASPDISFTDLSGHWGYDNVMQLVGMGAINGYNDGTFKPDNSITYAEYLTILVKTTKAGDGNYTAGDDEPWYNGVLRAAYESEIVGTSEVKDFGAPITRADAAKFTEKAVQKVLGEQEVDTKDMGKLINDYNSFKGKSSEYYILQQYSRGIIQGNDKGNFNPNDPLTRAEASTIILKTVKSDMRKDMSNVEVPSTPSNPDLLFATTGEQSITIYEGRPRDASNNRVAREGDIFVKSDGTQIILRKGSHGVVGEGQGVSADLNLVFTFGAGKHMENYIIESGSEASTNDLGYDSFGNWLASQRYTVNPLTGEGHWDSEWTRMGDGINNPDKPSYLGVGTEEGQLSEDKNWVWSGMYWVSVAMSPQYLK